ncbi:uncharacterized protein LOC126614928 [Malus sylvestris]|uniref:uncharacterized protein LOC126614928 n=1 Tax=Malus sylvestris TaxID=3752 RepID=UPI0021AC19E3|nr:uncharacterized protein LOC126614928 [Malus sylvestris]
MDDRRRRRRKAHSSAAFEEDKNMDLKNSNDHWAFLEEIEAPMWVDLTLEANSTNQHIDDDWFYRSHLFHQNSSRQLKAAFSTSGEDSIGLNFDFVGPSSPQLPSSVSKSRGKDFVSKKWRGGNQDFADKRHLDKVLSGTSSCGNSGSSDKMKPKSSFIQLKGTSSSKSSSVCKSSLTTNHIPSCSKPTSSGGDPTCSLSSGTNKADESSTTSTITSEIGQQQQQQKFMEKSNPVLSQANGIFSVIKAGFRKSGITRPAARVEIHGDRRQSRVHKSSSSKSSVGSSSNPRSEGRASTSTSIQYKERTPDSRNVARMSYATKNRIRPSIVSKPSTHKIERGTANNRMGPNVSNSVHVEAAKPKVQYQIQRRKPLESVRVNENKSTTATVKSKEKPVVGGSNRMAASGKENVKGKMAGSQKCSNKGIAPVTMVWSPKGTKQSILQRTDRTGLAGKGKVGGQSHLVSLKDIPKRPHFR